MEGVVKVESENRDEGADVEVEVSNKEKELDNDIGVGKDSTEEVWLEDFCIGRGDAVKVEEDG